MSSPPPRASSRAYLSAGAFDETEHLAGSNVRIEAAFAVSFDPAVLTRR
ncbi:hypothetical protein [Streptomyces anulatus]